MRDQHRIAIIGIGLRCPDATSPVQLWENVLSGRRPFRGVACANSGDSTSNADRMFRLARDVVSAALADAGYRDAVGLPRATTSVVLGSGGGPGTTGSCHAALAAGIADHFELGGGGFTVGGGGSPALLPVIAAAAALLDHDVDVAVAGGISVCGDDADRLDDSGLLVLMREADAVASGRRIYASITGSGISSDDRGADGRHLALARAYRKAGYPVDTVSYFEGNDPAVATALSSAGATEPVPVGRDTGFTGLIKAVLAVHNQVIPPAADPHEPVPATPAGLYLPTEAALWPNDRPIRVGVSARGSGGINTHVTIEEIGGRQHPSALAKRTVALTAGRQDAEVLLIDAPDRTTLRARVTELADRCARLAAPELTDLAGLLAAEVSDGPARAAVVAAGPADAHRTLTMLRDALASGAADVFSADDGVFFADRATPPRIAFLFPGRESGGCAIGAIRRRFALADTIVRIAADAVSERPTTWTQRGTPDAVPSTCVVAASLAATRVLRALGVDAHIATGPGVGELTTLAWGGALGGADLLRLATSAAPATDLAAIPLMPLHREIVQIGGELRDPSPVATEHAVATAVRGATLAIEVGPGHALTALTERIAPGVRVLSVDTDSTSLVPLLRVVAAAHAFGVPIDTTILFAGRVIRPLPAYEVPEPLGGEVSGVAPWVATFALPDLRPLPRPAGVMWSSPLGTTDVLLVTGGERALTAACATAMVRDSRARLATLSPADLAEPASVVAAVRRIEAEFGPVTAILHGAADGLRAVLDSVAADQLKLLVTFDDDADLTVRFGHERPRTRTVAVAWSDWSIPVDPALAAIRRILADPSTGPRVLVSGRAADLASPHRPWPAESRFVDRILAHYPGVELVTETDLTVETDPYLEDHVVAGESRFPVAMAIEAMVATATAISGHQNGPALLTDVEFLEPIAGPGPIRVAALVRDTEATDVVLRTGGTGFATDHLRATVRQPRPNVPVSRAEGRIALPPVPIDPVTELYGGTLARGKRFQRLLAFRRVTANRVVAEVATTAPAPWFAPALPQDLVTADPGTRDAVLQVAQCLVPGATLVPHGVARLHLSARRDQDIEYVVVDARERQRDGELHHVDVDVLDPAGGLVERWEGLTFRVAPTAVAPAPWVPALLGPHIERTLRQVIGGHQTVIVEPDPVPPAPEDDPADSTPRQADLAAGRAFGHPVRLRYGPDGEPVGLGASVAVDHGASMTLLVTGRGRLGCAISVVEDRSVALADHEAVLDRLTAELGEPAAVAGARVWTALRALRHTPASPPTLTFDRGHPDGWVSLRAGDIVVATWVTNINDRPDPVVFAVMSGEERCHG